MTNPICRRCNGEIAPRCGNRFNQTHLDPLECIRHLRKQRDVLQYQFASADSAVNWLLEHPSLGWLCSTEMLPEVDEFVLIHSDVSGYDLVIGLYVREHVGSEMHWQRLRPPSAEKGS